MPSLSESLAAYVFETELAAIPAPVQATAKHLLLDTLAVARAGSDAPGLAQRVEVVVDAANTWELAPAGVELVTTAHGTLRRSIVRTDIDGKHRCNNRTMESRRHSRLRGQRWH